MLAIMIKRAKADGQIEGVVTHIVDGGLSILQYADDTIFFVEHDLDKARNMKLVLSAFEQLSGLKINFHKSELFCFGGPRRSQPLCRTFWLSVGPVSNLLLRYPDSFPETNVGRMETCRGKVAKTVE
jgi:hypothetical protein